MRARRKKKPAAAAAVAAVLWASGRATAAKKKFKKKKKKEKKTIEHSADGRTRKREKELSVGRRNKGTREARSSSRLTFEDFLGERAAQPAFCRFWDH